MKSHLARSAVPTPALVVDLDALERNIATMAAFVGKMGKRLRPHAKTHKCVPIARLQLAAGASGISCATLDELAAMVAAGIPGLLLTSPIAGDPKFAHLLELLQRDPDISVVVDDPQAVAILDALAKGLGVHIRVLVDFDVGQRRTGSPSVAAAVALAREVRARSGLKFGGIQAYAGHIQHIVEPRERRVACEAVSERVRTLCAALTSEQLDPRIVTGAGTGTAEFDAPARFTPSCRPGRMFSWMPSTRASGA
jgi:D-serine deaminase-like pyridoxal phosphate-dependent protein